jgi:hypothetical protein
LFAAQTEAFHSVRWANSKKQNPIFQNLTQQKINKTELRKCKIQTNNVRLPPKQALYLTSFRARRFNGLHDPALLSNFLKGFVVFKRFLMNLR